MVAAVVVGIAGALVVGERFAGPAVPEPVPRPTPFAVPGTWRLMGQFDAAVPVEDDYGQRIDVIADPDAFAAAWEATGPDPLPAVDFTVSTVLWIRAGFGSNCEDLTVVNVGERVPGRLAVDLGLEFESDGCNDDFNPRTWFVEVALADLSAPPVEASFSA